MIQKIHRTFEFRSSLEREVLPIGRLLLEYSINWVNKGENENEYEKEGATSTGGNRTLMELNLPWRFLLLPLCLDPLPLYSEESNLNEQMRDYDYYYCITPLPATKRGRMVVISPLFDCISIGMQSSLLCLFVFFSLIVVLVQQNCLQNGPILTFFR